MRVFSSAFMRCIPASCPVWLARPRHSGAIRAVAPQLIGLKSRESLFDFLGHPGQVRVLREVQTRQQIAQFLGVVDQESRKMAFGSNSLAAACWTTS